MGAGKRVRQRFADKGGRAQARIAKALDALAEYEEFKESVLPALRNDLKAGMTPEEIREKYSAIVQASIVSMALTASDPKARLAAGKDVIDRHEGRAKERGEVTHRFENMPEEQVDSVLQSMLEGVTNSGADEDKAKH